MNAMQALERCRRAWEHTNPQLVLEGWAVMMDGLDDQETVKRADQCPAAALLIVEPAPDAPSLPLGRGGLHQTTTEQGANLSQRSRALLQEGV